MTAPRGAVLFTGPGEWRIAALTGGAVAWTHTGIAGDAAPEDVAARLPAALDRAGCRGRRVVVALASAACLAASVPTAGLPRKDRRRAMAYRLEEKFPLAIEDVAADFVVHDGRALGVCARAEAVAAVAGAVERAGAKVAAVVPAAMLGARLETRPGADATPADAVLWQASESADLFVMDAGTPVEWYSVAAAAPDVALALAPWARSRGRRLRVAARGRERAGLLADLRRLADVEVVDPLARTCADAAADAGLRVLAGERPVVDLRPGGAGGADRYRAVRGPLTAAFLAGLLLCFCLTGAMLWRGSAYADLADKYDAQKREAFAGVFPGAPVPLGVASRLRSYARRSDGPQGRRPAGPSALALLRDVLTHLPADARFRVEEMEINPGQVLLRGQVPSHAAADSLATALRAAKGLSVDDPRTRELEGGAVEFTLTAQVTPAKDAGGTP